MAKLFINKNITRESEKAFSFFFTGEEGISYADVNDFLSHLGEDEPIDVELYSCGGDCTEGFAIYDALRTCGHPLTTTVVGECASMATVLMLCAPKESRRAFKHARFLIHEPYFPESICGDVTIQRIETLRQALEDDKRKILDVYVERTGQRERKIVEQMDDGTWFDAERAMALGFISEIVPETSAAVKDEPRISTTINDRVMKEKKTSSVAKAFNALASALGMSSERPVALSLTATDGTELTIEREEGDIQVGDPASPDGVFTLEDGRTITIKGGEIVSIVAPDGGEDVSAESAETEVEDTTKSDLEEKIAEMENIIRELREQVSEMEESVKTDEDKAILSAVSKLGGVDFLRSLPAGKAVIPTQPNSTGQAETVNVFAQILKEKLNTKN